MKKSQVSIYKTISGNKIIEKKFFVESGMFLGEQDITKTYYGLCDKDNKEILPIIYDKLWTGSNKNNMNYVLLQKDYESFIYDCKSNKMIAPAVQKSYLYMFCGEYIQFINNDSLFGMLDLDGKIKIPGIYQEIRYINDELIFTKLNNLWGITDINGTVLHSHSMNYDEIGYINDGLINVSRNNKSGFIDQTGREIIPCNYDYSSAFNNGYAIVGMIYSNDYRESFNDDNTIISYYKSNLEYGVIDKNNNAIIPIAYKKNNHDILKYSEPRENSHCLIKTL